MSQRVRTARLTAVGVLAFLLLNFPLLSLADSQQRVLGVPVLWLYLFVVWVVLILVLRAIVRRTE
ncbi:MAG: hypothetical protein U0Q19_09040 [Kineosporiaceae bacterium]